MSKQLKITKPVTAFYLDGETAELVVGTTLNYITINAQNELVVEVGCYRFIIENLTKELLAWIRA